MRAQRYATTLSTTAAPSHEAAMMLRAVIGNPELARLNFGLMFGRFALDVEHDNGPAVGGSLLDEHLCGVGLAGSHGSKNADVPRQHALVLCIEPEPRRVRRSRNPSEHHAALKPHECRGMFARDEPDL